MDIPEELDDIIEEENDNAEVQNENKDEENKNEGEGEEIVEEEGEEGVEEEKQTSTKDNKKKNDNTPLTSGNLIPKFMRNEPGSALAIEFSPNDEFFAVGLSNSVIKLYQTSTGALVSVLGYPKVNSDGINIPCTSLSFRNVGDNGKRTKNMLIAGYANGASIHWHVTSGKAIQMNFEKNNQINTVCYNKYGSQYATAGSDCHVRVYDAATTKNTYDFYYGKDSYTSGHSNKIFNVKFHPKDPNILLSGGWDNTIQIWDCRVKYSVNSIYGPHICGDSLDLDSEGEYILSGSYSRESPLQLWTYNTCLFSKEILWTPDNKRRSMIYSAHYSHSPTPNYIYAGGGNSNEAKIFSIQTNKCLGTAYGFKKPVYSVAMSHNEEVFVVGDGSNHIYYYSIDPSVLEAERAELKESHEAELIAHYFNN